MKHKEKISAKTFRNMTISVSLWVLLLCFGAGCGEEQQPIVTHMFFGTVTSTSINASTSWAFLRLMKEGAKIDGSPLYLASCQLSGPSCDFQINEVVEGNYTVFGLIDQNANVDRSNPLPDSGDLMSPGRPLILLSRQQMDFPDEAWRLLP